MKGDTSLITSSLAVVTPSHTTRCPSCEVEAMRRESLDQQHASTLLLCPRSSRRGSMSAHSAGRHAALRAHGSPPVCLVWRTVRISPCSCSQRARAVAMRARALLGGLRVGMGARRLQATAAAVGVVVAMVQNSKKCGKFHMRRDCSGNSQYPVGFGWVVRYRPVQDCGIRRAVPRPRHRHILPKHQFRTGPANG